MNLNFKKFILPVIVIAVLFSAWHSVAYTIITRSDIPTDSADMFKNPIRNGADPWVTKYKEYYYVCKPMPGGIGVGRSKDLTKAGPTKLVWHHPDTGWNRTCIWAPELHHVGKKWYIYYAGGKSGPPYTYQRSGVLESVTDDPLGKYVDKGMLHTGDDPQDSTKTIWAIDLTVEHINNQLYAVWSGWEKNRNTDKTPQLLYMAKMSNPWTISSERVKISAPEQAWETGGPLNLNEGPEFIKHNGDIFIIYSTRESWTPAYRLGQLRLKDSTQNPMNPNAWVKTGPVFMGTPQVLGVGHASFTTSPDGTEWWIMYHSKKERKPGWDRDVRIQKFGWQPDGSPDFGMPQPAGTWMKKPSGEN